MVGLLKPFEVSEDHIQSLEAVQLVQLIKKLAIADLHAAGIPLSALDGSLKINVADGGEDIRIEWTSPQTNTNFIPNPFTVFQLKAEKLTDAKVKKEPLEKNGSLKAAVDETVTRKGAYVLITSKMAKTPTRGAKGSNKKKKPRIDEMRAVLRQTIENAEPKAVGLTIDAYGPSKIVEWVNSHPMVAIWLKQTLGLASADFGLQTLKDWSTYAELSNPLVTWDDLNKHMLAIQDGLLRPRSVIRLQGHSGIGKSRLAYEALAKTESDPKTDLTSLVAYAREAQPGLIFQVRDFVKNNNRVVLVVDECPPDAHRQLSAEVHRNNSRLSLITLDLSFDETDDKRVIVDAVPLERVREILVGSGFNGSKDDLERAANFCSGFPQIAVLVGKASAEGAQHFADYKNREHVVERLVWGRSQPDADLMQVVRCLAAFDIIGFDEPRDGEFRWIAENLLDTDVSKLEQKLEHFIQRRIVQRRGYSLLVVPKPLAAYLAATYWKTVSREKRTLLLSGAMPPALQTALCERLADLNYTEDARKIAAQLCGQTGPFGSAEVLNTEFGAGCLRKLAEVAPEEVASTLVSIFGDWEVAKIRELIGPGRRNLVGTIDIIAWEPAIFSAAMRIALKFAGGENETWANNATGEFVQRFRVQLPGTNASLSLRIECLAELIAASEAEERPVLVSALGSAIDARGHSRMVGSEHHGTRKTYEDYHPKTYGEIHEYVREALRLLLVISKTHPDQTDNIRRALATIDPVFVIAEPVFGQYVELVNHIRPKGEVWGQLLEKLTWSLQHQLGGTEPEVGPIRMRVRALIDNLLPKTLSDRIRFYVKSVPWHFVEPGESEDIDFELNRKRARSLAEEAAGDRQTFEKLLPDLSSGEVREGFAFAESLYAKADWARKAVDLAIHQLEVLHDSNPNPSLLAGLLAGLFKDDPREVQTILRQIAASEKTRNFLVYLASVNLTNEALALVSTELAAGAITPGQARLLGMGSVLDQPNLTEVRNLIRILQDKNAEGETVAVELLGMYVLRDEQKFLGVRDLIDSALLSDAIFNAVSETMVEHHYETLADKILVDPEFGKDLAEYIANSLIKAARRDHMSGSRHFQTLAASIFKTHPELALDIFAEAVERSDAKDRLFLSHILGSPFSFKGKGDGPLFSLDEELILSACKQYPKRFAVMVAELAPLFATSAKGRDWTPLAHALLDTFGDRKDIMDAISRNMFTGGWMGPTSDRLRAFVAPLERLKLESKRPVRTWAGKHLIYLQQQIERELKNEEEEAVRSG